MHFIFIIDQRLDWTYDKQNFNELPEIIDDLHKHGQRYINIIVLHHHFLQTG